MIKKQIYSLMLLGFLSSCSKPQEETQVPHEHAFYVDLNESAEIVVQLIRTDNLHKLMEDEGVDEIALNNMIKNFSPAMIALEFEALSHSVPSIICYHKVSQRIRCIEVMQRLHEVLPDAKYVLVDVEALYQIAYNSKVEIDETPAIIIVSDREEVAWYHLDDHKDDISAIENKLRSLNN